MLMSLSGHFCFLHSIGPFALCSVSWSNLWTLFSFVGSCVASLHSSCLLPLAVC